MVAGLMIVAQLLFSWDSLAFVILFEKQKQKMKIGAQGGGGKKNVGVFETFGFGTAHSLSACPRETTSLWWFREK